MTAITAIIAFCPAYAEKIPENCEQCRGLNLKRADFDAPASFPALPGLGVPNKSSRGSQARYRTISEKIFVFRRIASTRCKGVWSRSPKDFRSGRLNDIRSASSLPGPDASTQTSSAAPMAA